MKDRIYGAPNFVVEVLSPSTKKTDTDKERVICYFFEEDGLLPNVYTFDSEVPVRIYSGELKIRLSE